MIYTEIFRNLCPGDKVAIRDKNINGEYFYVEATFVEYTNKGYVITDSYTFTPAYGRNIGGVKEIYLIDDCIKDEIDKLQIRKFIHSNLQHYLSKMSLTELITIRDIIVRRYTNVKD